MSPAHEKPIKVSEGQRLIMTTGTAIALGAFLITCTTGFLSLRSGVVEAKEQADLAIFRERAHEQRIEEAINALQASMRDDHDRLTRIDENVKFLREQAKKP